MNSLKHEESKEYSSSITIRQLLFGLLYGIAVTLIVIVTASWF
jgi:hypothetical protein